MTSTTFGGHFQEKLDDLWDWVDFRPDPNWMYWFLPAAVATVGLALAPAMIAVAIAGLAFALLGLVLLCGAIFALGWVIVSSSKDYLRIARPSQFARVKGRSLWPSAGRNTSPLCS